MTAEKYFLESKKTDNFVELSKDKDDNVWMEKYHIDNSDYDSTLEFCNMLKNAFETAKNKGGQFHSQYVNKDAWDEFLKKDDRWDIVSECDGVYHIQCDIDDAPMCIIEAFFDNQTFPVTAQKE